MDSEKKYRQWEKNRDSGKNRDGGKKIVKTK